MISFKGGAGSGPKPGVKKPSRRLNFNLEGHVGPVDGGAYRNQNASGGGVGILTPGNSKKPNKVTDHKVGRNTTVTTVRQSFGDGKTGRGVSVQRKKPAK